ncbi:MAG: hypothetical protein FJ146_07875 [Deltaproteobacteria bacterium]|nr:hypothetical protein [Deltaproteobacteria bacterium]
MADGRVCAHVTTKLRCISWLLALMLALSTTLPACKTTGSGTKSADVPVTVTDSSASLRIMAGDPRTILVLFTGAYMKPAVYTALAQKIVQLSGGSVGVFVPHFLGDFTNPLQSDGAVNEAVKYLKERGVDQPASHVFLAGHSAGGIFASDAPLRFKLPGLILLASYLPRTPVIGKNLNDYQRPVLTLGGELDGLTGINYMAREHQVMQNLAESDAAAILDKPVIVLRGVKHAQFADGTPADGDVIDGAVDLDEAHGLIGRQIVDFIAAQSIEGAIAGVTKADGANAIKESVAATKQLLQPYFASENALADLCQFMQKSAFALDADGWSRVDFDVKTYVSLLSQPAFIFDKSSVTKINDRIKLHLPMYVDQDRNITDVSKDRYLSPKSVSCKMRSQEAFVAESGLTSSAVPLNCAQMNQKIIASAISLVIDEKQLDRLKDRYGNPARWDLSQDATEAVNSVSYGPFRIRSSRKSTGQQFIASGFRFERDGTQKDQWILDTAELQTGKTAVIQQFAGANYCKLIPPERVIEWATLFGLK